MTESGLAAAIALSERHFDLVMAGALPEDSPLDCVTPAPIPDGDYPWPAGGTNQSRYEESVKRFIAVKAAGRHVSVLGVRYAGPHRRPHGQQLEERRA